MDHENAWNTICEVFDYNCKRGEKNVEFGIILKAVDFDLWELKLNTMIRDVFFGKRLSFREIIEMTFAWYGPQKSSEVMMCFFVIFLAMVPTLYIIFGVWG